MLQELADASFSAIHIIIGRAIESRQLAGFPKRVVVVTNLASRFAIHIRSFPIAAHRPFSMVPVAVPDISNVPVMIERLIWPSHIQAECVILDEPAIDAPRIRWQRWRDVVILQDPMEMLRSSIAESYNCP